MQKTMIFGLTVFWLTMVLGIPARAGWDPARDQREKAAVQQTIARFKAADSTMQLFFDKAYGYVVFPTVGKGGFILGGAHGKGYVYEKGILMGYARMTQITVGAQVGGQSYSEMIFFKDESTLDDFKAGNFEFAAQASAVAVTEGASKDASYDRGAAVFTIPKGGLMAEATIGGQKFKFYPR